MAATVRTADGREYVVAGTYEEARDTFGELARGGYASWEVELDAGGTVTLPVRNVTGVLEAPAAA